MKVSTVTFEATECDALERLVKYAEEHSDIAKVWRVEGAIKTLREHGLPKAGDEVGVPDAGKFLEAVYAFALNTDGDEHLAAGCNEDQSEAVWKLYNFMRDTISVVGGTA